MTGAAGSTSKQLSMKQRGEELFTVGKLKEGGGTEGHDVMYGSEDPVEDPRIFEVPEIFPEKFQGAAGMSSKDISHSSAAGGYMFGEICDGLALGAGHRTTVTKLPTHMDLNATFMRSTGAWARPDYPNEGYYGGLGLGVGLGFGLGCER